MPSCLNAELTLVRYSTRRVLFSRTLAPAALLVALCGHASALEREPSDTDNGAAPAKSQSASKLGYASSSELRVEPSAKSFFFLNNAQPFPRPAPAQPLPVYRDMPAPAPVAKPDSKPEAVKVAMAPKRKRTDLPKIEKILADVRAASAPSIGSLPPVVPAAPAQVRVEAEGQVDYNKLIQDLTQTVPGVAAEAAPGEGPTPAIVETTVADAPLEMPVWAYGAAAAVLAGVLGWLGIRWTLRRKADASAAKDVQYLESLSHARRAADTIAKFHTAKQEATRQEESEKMDELEQVLADEPPAVKIAVPSSAPAATAQPSRRFELSSALTDQLGREPYSTVVALAKSGMSEDEIAQKTSLGPGEIRLVLDLAQIAPALVKGGAT